jgi:hypothetical protein
MVRTARRCNMEVRFLSAPQLSHFDSISRIRFGSGWVFLHRAGFFKLKRMTRREANKLLAKAGRQLLPVHKKAGKSPASSKAKDAIRLLLYTYVKQRWGIDVFTDYRFDATRFWKFDWAMPVIKVAVEYEGLFSAKSRHTTATGYSGDTEKYNAAALQGWRVLRYTALTYKNLPDDLAKL